MTITRFHIIVLVVALITSCENEEEQNMREGAVAKAYDEFLHYDEISGITPGMHSADSINIIHSAIDNWLKEQLTFQMGQTQLSASVKSEIQRKVAAYERELYTFAYEKEVVDQKMDKSVADSVIEEYYTKYISNYLLEEAYLRFIYVRCDRKDYIKEVSSWMKDSIDIYTLEDFCSEELQMCHLEPEEWVSQKKFLSTLSEIDVDMKKLHRDGFLDIKEKNIHYLIRILDFKDKGEPAPLTFVKKDITSILLKSRRAEFLKSFQRQLVSSETVKGNVKIYTNDKQEN